MVGVLRFRNSETGEWQDINAIKGVPGDDYILTQEDREEIAGLVGTEDFYTKAQIDDKLDEIDVPEVDLSNYYTKTEIDEALDNVSVDLSNYYTKTEIDGLLADLPVGDIPSGEEVEF